MFKKDEKNNGFNLLNLRLFTNFLRTYTSSDSLNKNKETIINPIHKTLHAAFMA